MLTYLNVLTYVYKTINQMYFILYQVLLFFTAVLSVSNILLFLELKKRNGQY